MKVAYLFITSGHTVDYKLAKMILPQLEAGTHGAEVVGMFSFDDNAFVLRNGDPLGERLAKVARERNIWLGVCDRRFTRATLAHDHAARWIGNRGAALIPQPSARYFGPDVAGLAKAGPRSALNSVSSNTPVLSP